VNQIIVKLFVLQLDDVAQLLNLIKIDAPFFVIIKMSIQVVSKAGHLATGVLAFVLGLVEIAPALQKFARGRRVFYI